MRRGIVKRERFLNYPIINIMKIENMTAVLLLSLTLFTTCSPSYYYDSFQTDTIYVYLSLILS